MFYISQLFFDDVMIFSPFYDLPEYLDVSVVSGYCNYVIHMQISVLCVPRQRPLPISPALASLPPPPFPSPRPAKRKLSVVMLLLMLLLRVDKLEDHSLSFRYVSFRFLPTGFLFRRIR